MKKLIILTLMLMGAFTIAATTQVAAVDPQAWDDEWDVSIVNTDETWNSAIQASMKIPAGAKELTLIIPSSVYQALTSTATSSVSAYVEFRESDDITTLATLGWDDQFGSQLAGSFRIDLEAIGAANARYVHLLIPQTFAYNNQPPLYIDYLEDNMSYSYEYAVTTPNYFLGEKNSSYHRYGLHLDVPHGTKSLSIYTRTADYELSWDDTYYSKVDYFDDTDGYLYTDNLETNIRNQANVIDIGLDFDEVGLNETKTMILYLYYDPDIVNFADIEIANDVVSVEFNERALIEVNYYVGSTLEYTADQLLGFIYPSYTPDALEGFEFAYWMLPDGQILYSYTGIAADHVLEGDIVNLHGVFFFAAGSGGIGTGDNPDPDSSRGVNKLLAVFGADTTVGHMLFFLILIIFLTYLVIAKLKAPTFVAIIADALLMILFTYWGLIPTYVTMSVSIFLIVGGLMTLKTQGGEASE